MGYTLVALIRNVGPQTRVPVKWSNSLCDRLRRVARREEPCPSLAYVPEDWPERAIDVLVDGVPVATWRFTSRENRGTRSVTLSGNVRSHTVEFRPHSVVSPRDLDPSHQDGRPLALALGRFMVRGMG